MILHGLKLNPDTKLRDSILEAIQKNNGYCPCQLDQNEDTKCPCKLCREEKECECGLYVRINELDAR